MSTRSIIGKFIDNGSRIKAIYCHWDGYPEHNGKILVNFYTDQDKIDQLIELGDLSSLGPEIGWAVEFEDREAVYKLSRVQCIAYGRDRRENNIAPRICRNLQELVEMQSDAEYVYIWNGTAWACYVPSGRMVDLSRFKNKEPSNDMA